MLIKVHLNSYKYLILALLLRAPLACADTNVIDGLVDATYEYYVAGFADFSLLNNVIRFWASPYHNAFVSVVTRTDTDEQSVDNLVKQTVAQAQKKSDQLTWWVTPYSRPANLAQVLQANNFVLVGKFPAMGCYLKKFPAMEAVENLPKVPEICTIKRVTQQEELKQFNAIVSLCFGYDQPTKQQSFKAMHKDLSNTNVEYYMGYIDGKPVVTGLFVVVEDKVAGIYAIATSPEFRRRGLATQMTS